MSVYFAKCTNYPECVKIGSCLNFVDRLSTYKTSFPFVNIKPYCIILTNKYTLTETVFLQEFKNYSTTSHPNYVDGGIEWILFDITVNVIKTVMDKYQLVGELLIDDNLNTYLKNLQRKIKKKENKINKLRLKEYNDYVKNLNKIVLRDYQTNCYEKSQKYYSIYTKGIINWTCGLGKTIISIYMTKLYNKIIIGVPSNLLLKQWLYNVKKYCNKPVLLISSLYFNSTQSTTDKKYVNNWISMKNNYIIITTYHSSHIVLNLSFDFSILDECHHLCQINDNKFNQIFHIRVKNQLALSATLKIHDTNIIYNKFGNIIDSKSTLWAITNKFITDYEIITMRIEHKYLLYIMSDIIGNIEYLELFMASFATVLTMIKYKYVTHVLLYANSINNSKILIRYIQLILNRIFTDFNIPYYKSLNSDDTKISNLEAEIKKFSNSSVGIISSVYIFGEGFDLPKVNGICIAENMESNIRIVQSVLRGNRLEPSNPNKINRIILPYDDDFQHTFDKIANVIHKLGNYDKNITQKIKACVIGKSDILSNDISIINPSIRINNIEELEYIKLKIKPRMTAENTYNYLRSKNIILNIKSRREYFESYMLNNEKLENPPKYFNKLNPKTWKSWYDFLGLDISIYPKTKAEWYRICIYNGINQRNYKSKYQEFNLPEYPNDLYKDFTNFRYELRIKNNRRM
jgi:superfamily II DNA or RNA helicase